MPIITIVILVHSRQDTVVSADGTADDGDTVVSADGTADDGDTVVSADGTADDGDTVVSAYGTADDGETWDDRVNGVATFLFVSKCFRVTRLACCD